MKINHLIFLLIPMLLAEVGCSTTKPPKKPFEDYTPSVAPDYSQRYTWAALPDISDFADVTPPSVSPENQANAPVDVFFIHPTTFMGGLAWNANVNDKELNGKTDQRAIKHQASVFNHNCRVYAPRYRQMSFGGFFSDDKVSEIKALNFAYVDVKESFLYYMEHYNQGRPIVIATHSQGTIHGIRLIKEFFDGKPLQDKLVAAYLIGWPFAADTMAFIPVCDSPDQTGCVISWNTWRRDRTPKNDFTHFYDSALVTNPLSWRADTAYAPESLHEGFLYPNYKKIKSQKLDAQAHNGLLWTKKPFPLAFTSNYHIGDYNLFWVNIRTNIDQRVKAYTQTHSSR